MNFALFLSPEGIALAHRQDAGHWALIGEVPFAANDLSGEMAGLKAAITTRGGADTPVLLVLPDDQILYTSFTAPTHDALLVQDRIIAGLDGLTPYAVADLVYDWRAVEEDRIKVAVVARETLGEAKDFAAEHGFVTAGYAAMPPVERYPGMPIFGEALAAITAATTDLRFGPDLWVAPQDPNEIETPEPSAAPEEVAQSPQPDADPQADEVLGDAPPPEQAVAGTAEKPVAKPKGKKKTAPKDDDGAQPQSELALASAAPASAPAVPHAAAQVEATPEAEATLEEAAPDLPASEADQAAAPEATPDSAADTGANAETKQEGQEPVRAAPGREAPTADDRSGADKSEDGDDAPPQEMGALAALLDPMFDRTITPIADVDTPDMAREPEPAPTSPAPEAPAPSAARGKVARPATDGRKLTAEKPETTPARPSGATATPVTISGTPDTAQDGAETTTGPIFGFSAKRRAGAKPGAGAGAETGKIVANLRGRLGFGAVPTEKTDKQRHPEVTTPPARRVDATADRPGSAFVAQLARVRDASKARPKPEPAAPQAAKAALDGGAAPSETAPSDAAPTPAARLIGAGAGKPAASGAGGADSALAAGLLARKSSQAVGPSLRTGLVLTVILLILLVLIAIWSVVFLPDSPMARLFGGGNTNQTAQSDTAEPAPIPAPSPPVATLATPDIAPAPPVANTADPEELADSALAEDAEIASIAPTVPAPAAPVPVTTALPDIDADLDLPPLPPMPEELLPTREQAEALYAAQRIWPRPPERPFFSPFTLTDDIYIASIDPEVVAFDAVALADPRIDVRELFRRVPAPPAFGAQIDRDARGLVTATAEGVLTPEGAFVILGQPVVAAIPRPREIAPEQTAPTASLNVEDAILGTIQPRQRPVNLDETRERQLLGGFSRTELAAMRPTIRPRSAQEAAAQASLFPQADRTPTEEAAPAAPVTGGTARAVAASRVPSLRPANFATIVAAATRRPAEPATVTATAFAPAPSIPSNADVARAATSRNEIRLRDINLIGITGTSSNRSALVRLSSGRFVRVAVGDRLDGGRVAAIGTDSLQYVVNGRNITLEIPG